MSLLLLQIVALVFLNAGIAALFEIMNTKSKRSKFLLMALAFFAASLLIYYFTAPELPVWQGPSNTRTIHSEK
jgi:hypothetical protein